MEYLKKGARVLVQTGYSDCQCRLEGYEGEVLARVGDRYLVRDDRGHTCYCNRSELLSLNAVAG